MSEVRERLETFIRGYVSNVTQGFDARWAQVVPEIYKKEVHEVAGGLLSRQATLTLELAGSPYIWNGHTAPLILRCMTDAHITLAWILGKPEERAKEYILYGLGQEKLFIEYLEAELQDSPEDHDVEQVKEMIDFKRRWLTSQLQEWAVVVNVGSWSGKTTRDMAKEAGCESTYKFAYVPFSGVAHNMWQHIAIYNLVPCKNSLHRHHLVPKVMRAPPHPDFVFRSAKYLAKSFLLVDEKFGLKCDVQLPDEYFMEHFPTDDDDNSEETDSSSPEKGTEADGTREQ